MNACCSTYTDYVGSSELPVLQCQLNCSSYLLNIPSKRANIVFIYLTRLFYGNETKLKLQQWHMYSIRIVV